MPKVAVSRILPPFNPTLLEIPIFYSTTLTLFTEISLNPTPFFLTSLSLLSRHQVQEISR